MPVDSADNIYLEPQLSYAWYQASPKAVLEGCKQKAF